QEMVLFQQADPAGQRQGAAHSSTVRVHGYLLLFRRGRMLPAMIHSPARQISRGISAETSPSTRARMAPERISSTAPHTSHTSRRARKAASPRMSPALIWNPGRTTDPVVWL